MRNSITIAGTAVLFAAIVATQAAAWQPGLPADSSFENPPLLYEGPDPTSNFFMPASLANWATAQPTNSAAEPLGELVPSSPPSQPFDGWSDYHEGPIVDEAPLACGGVTDFKNGFFQKLSVSDTWLDRAHRDDFGLHEIDTFVMVAVPAPSREWPLLISPTFNMRLVDGPVTPDLPAQLYEAYLDLLWVPQFTPRLMGIVGVAPSYYGDFQVDSEEAFRLTGKGLVRFDWIPSRVQILAGVLYLNRNDIKLLPAGGIVWTPSDARRYELIFPKPKLAHRIIVGPDFEDWLYLSAEFGGNTYAIERVTGANDFVTLRDIRTYVGLERKLNGGAGYRIEIGYVFARRAEYESGTPDVEPDDTAMLRGGFTF